MGNFNKIFKKNPLLHFLCGRFTLLMIGWTDFDELSWKSNGINDKHYQCSFWNFRLFTNMVRKSQTNTCVQNFIEYTLNVESINDILSYLSIMKKSIFIHLLASVINLSIVIEYRTAWIVLCINFMRLDNICKIMLIP